MLPAIRRRFREGTLNGGVKPLGQRGPMRREWTRHLHLLLAQHALGGGALEWRHARDHLVYHAPQRIDVGATVDMTRARCLLGAHVVQGAHGDARFGERVARLGGRDCASDAEIRDQCVPAVLFIEQDVLRFYIAVHHAVAMGVVERIGHLARDPHDVVQRQLPFSIDALAQRPTRHVRHDVVQTAVRLTGIEYGQHVRVGQLARDVDFPEEALGGERGDHVGTQHFDGDGAV
jgi:hypothetical protein